MNINELKILVCDDSLLARKRLKDCIISFGCSSIFEAANGEEAIAQYNDNKPNLVFMDIVMPKKDGIDALKDILEIDSDATVIMASSVLKTLLKQVPVILSKNLLTMTVLKKSSIHTAQGRRKIYKCLPNFLEIIYLIKS